MAEQTNSASEQSPLLIIKELEGNQPTQLHGAQPLLMTYSAELTALWWVILFATVIGVLRSGWSSREVK